MTSSHRVPAEDCQAEPQPFACRPITPGPPLHPPKHHKESTCWSFWFSLYLQPST